MKSPTLESNDSLIRDPPEFSLVLGGLLFQLFHRARLIPDCLASLRLGSGHALADKK